MYLLMKHLCMYHHWDLCMVLGLLDTQNLIQIWNWQINKRLDFFSCMLDKHWSHTVSGVINQLVNLIWFDLMVLFYMGSLNKTRSLFYIKVHEAKIARTESIWQSWWVRNRIKLYQMLLLLLFFSNPLPVATSSVGSTTHQEQDDAPKVCMS